MKPSPPSRFGRVYASVGDLELAGLAGRGDREAFGELVRRATPLVRALVRRMGAQPRCGGRNAHSAQRPLPLAAIVLPICPARFESALVPLHEAVLLRLGAAYMQGHYLQKADLILAES